MKFAITSLALVAFLGHSTMIAKASSALRGHHDGRSLQSNGASVGTITVTTNNGVNTIPTTTVASTSTTPNAGPVITTGSGTVIRISTVGSSDDSSEDDSADDIVDTGLVADSMDSLPTGGRAPPSAGTVVIATPTFEAAIGDLVPTWTCPAGQFAKYSPEDSIWFCASGTRGGGDDR